MNNTILASALGEVFDESSNEFMKSVAPQNGHVFSRKFKKKIRRIIRTRANPFRLFYVERHILINTFGMIAIMATVALMVILKSHNGISEYATASFAEIKSSSEIPTKEYSNLDFSNAVLNLPDADKLYKVYFNKENNYTFDECTKYSYELFDIVFDYVKEENPNKTFTDHNGDPLPEGEANLIGDINGQFFQSQLYLGIDDEKGYQCRFSNNGSFIMYGPVIEIAAVGAEAPGIVEEIIHLDRGEPAPDKKYLVDGKEYSSAQALDFAEKFMAEKLSKYLPGDGVSPTELVIIKDPDSDNYMYRFQFEHVFKGTPYFHLSLDPSLETGDHTPYGVIYITIASPDRIGEIYNMMHYAKAEYDGELKDKYIPLEKAADMVNEYLAPYFKQKISEVTIKYLCPDIHTDFHYDGSQESVQQNPDITYARPYWCFIIDKADPVSGDYCLSGKAILVDMQTGEITTHINVNR